MREIKFKAWDKVRKRMSEPFSFEDISEQGLTIGYAILNLKGTKKVQGRDLPIVWRFDIEEFGKSIELLQFTGLKDKFGNNKTGKEIYEGDIVKHQNGYLYIVEFDTINCWWCLVQPRKKDGNTLQNIYTGGINGQEIWRCKVIGNIYENPELIKEKKK